jgi:cob(I)alamin adenosyltransferase
MIAQLDLTQLDYVSPAPPSDPLGLACSMPHPIAVPPGVNPGVHAIVDPLQVQGLVQVVTAPHRSFFTQVLAQALRSAGQGTPVLVVQLLKGGIGQGIDHPVRLGQCLEWYRCDCPMSIDPYSSHPLPETVRRSVQHLWNHVQSLILADRYELVILDELSLALKRNLIAEGEVIQLLQRRPPRVELILTGPGMPKSLLQLADQVTQLRRPLQA